MVGLTPFLLFDGDCDTAMGFYHDCLGGELTLTRLGDTPMKAQVPPAHHHKVVHAHLKAGSVEFSATDWLHPTRVPKPGNTVALYLNGGTYPELRLLFDKLSVGGDDALRDDLVDLPFGSYGHLVDRFGIHWFFQGDPRGN